MRERYRLGITKLDARHFSSNVLSISTIVIHLYSEVSSEPMLYVEYNLKRVNLKCSLRRLNG